MLVAFMLFGVAALAYAEDITTTDGITYTNAEVHRVEPDGITVMHSGGVAKIQPAKLPDDVRETGETGDVLCNYLLIRMLHAYSHHSRSPALWPMATPGEEEGRI